MERHVTYRNESSHTSDAPKWLLLETYVVCIWERYVTRSWTNRMSYMWTWMNESHVTYTFTNELHVTYVTCVMSHVWMSAFMNESSHLSDVPKWLFLEMYVYIYEDGMSHIWMYHVSRVNASQGTHGMLDWRRRVNEGVIAHEWRANESCLTYEWVMSHI